MRLQMRRVLLVFGMLAAATVIEIGGLGAVEERIIYSYRGNTLVADGGDKIQVDLRGYRFPKAEGPRVEPSAIKTISDIQRTHYGDAYVETSFYSTVCCDIWTSFPQWAEVEGEPETNFSGAPMTG